MAFEFGDDDVVMSSWGMISMSLVQLSTGRI